MRLEYKQVMKVVGNQLDRIFQLENCFIEVNPGRVIMPRKFSEIGEMILDLKIKTDDVWVISYPRTGSTWAQEMIWLLGNRLDYDGATKMQQIRTPLLELSAVFSDSHNDWLQSSLGNSVSCVRSLPSPRFIKSHLPYAFLPLELDIVKPKIIYIARNPKDQCISYYHYCGLVHGLHASFDEFANLFLDGYAPIGPMWPHVLEFWNKRHESNILFLKYEDMKRDLHTTIRRCAKFLEIDWHLSDHDVQTLCDHLNFDRMQQNPAVNLEPIINHSGVENRNRELVTRFIRKGQIGDWKNYMTNAMSAKFDKWIWDNTINTGLEFIYD